jgi:hypothetical protein
VLDAARELTRRVELVVERQVKEPRQGRPAPADPLRAR